MKKYIKRVFAVVAGILCFAGCTKEIPDEPVQTDLMKVDLTGYWNAYGYVDFLGLVPLEIIQITKDGSGKYIATKVVGDNAVPSGMVTWEGYFTSNPFKADVTVGNGSTFSTVYFNLHVMSQNELRMWDFGLLFIRRTDGYFP